MGEKLQRWTIMRPALDPFSRRRRWVKRRTGRWVDSEDVTALEAEEMKLRTALSSIYAAWFNREQDDDSVLAEEMATIASDAMKVSPTPGDPS